MENIKFICKYCQREFDTKRSCGVHQRFCKKNPDGEKNIEIMSKAISKATTYERKTFIKVCPKCGKEFEVVATQSEFDKGRTKVHCSRSCANRHSISEETKQKISNSLTKTAAKKAEEHTRHVKTRYFCKICGKEIKKTRTGLCRHCLSCTPEGKKIMSESGKQGYKTSVERGHFHGWMSRNIDSYAEKFWMKVLDNNCIPYKREKKVGKYFLDFLITKNGHLIDLEIDGKQHQYEDRAQSDKLRDKFLRDNNYIVYRIPWNEISSDDGKKLMKTKIDNFLEFFHR